MKGNATPPQNEFQEILSTFIYYFHDYYEKASSQSAKSFTDFLIKFIKTEGCSKVYLHTPNQLEEFLRKIFLRFGLCHDTISLTQNSTAERVLSLRQKIAAAASLSLPKTGCRFLLRVDDYPSYFAPSDAFSKFHQIANENNIPYLLAITPHLHEEGLSAAEVGMLQKYRAEGMTPALHGFTHKRVAPGISSELAGVSEHQLRIMLNRSLTYLKSLKLEPAIFVAPFNSYDAGTISVLSNQFSILCGGPESVRGLGYRGPSFLGGSLYLPSYRGAYDLKNNYDWLIKAKTSGHGLIIPITLHWANDLKNNFINFKRLCEVIRPQVISWDNLLLRLKTISRQLPAYD